MNAKLETTMQEREGLKSAVDALRSYSRGSARGALEPLEALVRRSANSKELRGDLESALIEVLKSKPGAVASDAACQMLIQVGSDACTDLMGELLQRPESFESARVVLEALKTSKARQTLIGALSNATGSTKVGLIHSLGALREERSIRLLTQLALSQDVAVASAAVQAIGQIGSSRSARVLLALRQGVPDLILADSMLVCAEQRRAEGDKSNASKLRQAISRLRVPAFVLGTLEGT